jgi:hypothetical protein
MLEIVIVVGCEIRGESVKVRLRNRSGEAQQFFPDGARLFGLESGASLAATF